MSRRGVPSRWPRPCLRVFSAALSGLLRVSSLTHVPAPTVTRPGLRRASNASRNLLTIDDRTIVRNSKLLPSASPQNGRAGADSLGAGELKRLHRIVRTTLQRGVRAPSGQRVEGRSARRANPR